MPATWRSVDVFRTAGAMFVAAFGLTTSAVLADIDGPTGPPPTITMMWDTDADAVGAQSYDPDAFSDYQLNGTSHPFHNAGAATDWGQWTLGGPAGDRVRTGWRYRGGFMGMNDSYELTWDCVVNEDPFVDATINVTNNSLSAQTFWIYMPLGIVPTGPLATMNGSVSAALSSQSFFTPATLDTSGTDPVYQSYINPAVPQDPGAVVRTLWNPGYTLNAAPLASASDSDNFTNENTPVAVITDIAILLRFRLSAGDSASVTGIFEVQNVPGPAGLAAFAVFGAMCGSRRRRA